MVNVPTDKLCKYMAIGGLIIVLVTLMYVVKETNALKIDMINFQTEVNALQLKADNFIQFDLKQGDKNHLDKVAVLKIVNADPRLMDKFFDYQKELVLIEGKNTLLQEKYSQLSWYWRFGFVISILCAIVSAFGFRRWYLLDELNMQHKLRSMNVKIK